MDLRLGSYEDVLGDVKADLIFTSPPYNIGSRSVRIDGNRKHGLYDAKSYGAITDYPDSVPEDQYQDSQEKFFLWAYAHLAPKGVLVYNHKPRRVNGALVTPESWFLRPAVAQRLVLMESIVWDRGSTHNHSPAMMWPHTENLYVFRRAQDGYRLNNRTSENLPFRSNVWRVSSQGAARRSGGHNAPFPMELADGVIAAWSRPGELVCDPYMGSGTTAIAASRRGRRFVGSEVLPKYHALAVDRASDAVKTEESA